ncbi:uncharacterized protein Fot_40879 [Forsythia ovata]|uniref:Uncharacterized protein n=1 Tax=Forsythia ovata TaxID=205694 RepID=A0ABD1RGN9_9LAMI
MRIRKNAKISPLIYAASSLKPGTVLQTHVCPLNQSPWDVMNFSPPSTPLPPLPPSSFQPEPPLLITAMVILTALVSGVNQTIVISPDSPFLQPVLSRRTTTPQSSDPPLLSSCLKYFVSMKFLKIVVVPASNWEGERFRAPKMEKFRER